MKRIDAEPPARKYNAIRPLTSMRKLQRRVLKWNHPVLEVVENTGRISWLGVRDGIRNWLLTAA
jgi:hypothetical protein